MQNDHLGKGLDRFRPVKARGSVLGLKEINVGCWQVTVQDACACQEEAFPPSSPPCSCSCVPLSLLFVPCTYVLLAFGSGYALPSTLLLTYDLSTIIPSTLLPLVLPMLRPHPGLFCRYLFACLLLHKALPAFHNTSEVRTQKAGVSFRYNLGTLHYDLRNCNWNAAPRYLPSPLLPLNGVHQKAPYISRLWHS